jgi:hypothetical protein
VYGYGRKPQYLRWTTVLEHQLFAAEPNPPEIPEGFGKRNAPNAIGATFPKSPSLNPEGKPITVEAWFTSTKPNGVIVARGGPAAGFALTLQGGKPQFLVRARSELRTVSGNKRVVGGWHHVAGVLSEDKSIRLYVDGRLAGEGAAAGLINTDPVQELCVGADTKTAVGEYKSPAAFTGVIDEVRLYFTAATDDQIAKRFEDGSEISADAALAVSFDDGTARDHSLHRNSGTLASGNAVEGKFGKAIQFSTRKKGVNAGTKPGESLVKPKWAEDVPVYVRGMVLAGENLFIVGPPDIIDEEQTFEGLTENDPETNALLARQDAALNGGAGSSLLAVNIDTGEVKHEKKLDSLPTWDGLIGAGGRLFLTTLDGGLICFGN